MAATYDDIRKQVLDMKASRDAIMKRWDFYRNDVSREPYFPRLKDETEQHYKDRLKIVVGWCGSMANRVASYFRKGPIKVTFMVEGKEENALAQEASDLWAAVSDTNNYETFMIDVARDAGVGGNAYTKERFVFFDNETGEELKTGDYRGRVLIDRVNETFVYRVRLGDVNAFVEAWLRTPTGTKLLEQQKPDARKQDEFEYIELILPPYYDPLIGSIKTKANWTIWNNGAYSFGPQEIGFDVPMQRFANLVSRPESENGISDIEWAIPLNNMINHIFSGAARAIQYHGEPKLKFQGVDDPTQIKLGTDQAIYLPSGIAGQQPDVGFLTWDQNQSAAQAMYRDGADIISAISGVPKHMMSDLDTAGKVMSGVALRIMYESLNQVCTLKEAGFKAAEQKMIKACLSQLAYYNGKAGRFDTVSVQVEYNPDRTPRDMDAEFLADQKRMVTGYMNLVDLVIKYEPGIDTREQAMEFLRGKADEKKQLQAMGLVGAPITGEWADEPSDKEANDDATDN